MTNGNKQEFKLTYIKHSQFKSTLRKDKSKQITETCSLMQVEISWPVKQCKNTDLFPLPHIKVMMTNIYKDYRRSAMQSAYSPWAWHVIDILQQLVILNAYSIQYKVTYTLLLSHICKIEILVVPTSQNRSFG